MQAFERLRYGYQLLWLNAGTTYRATEGGPESFADLNDFVTHAESGGDVWYKNFVVQGQGDSGNNCQWRDELEMIGCALGDPETVIPGDDPFLDQTITVRDGRDANIMSYIAKSLDSTPEDLRVGFNARQARVLRMCSNQPSRMALRNLDLE